MSYRSSDVFSFCPYIMSDKPMSREEYKEEVMSRLSRVFPEIDVNECFDTDFKCEEIKTLTDKVKEFLEKYDYDSSIVVNAKIVDERKINNANFQLIYVDCAFKLDEANLTILSINDVWYLPSNDGAYPMNLEDARMYMWANDKTAFIFNDEYAQFPLEEKALTYSRLEYLNTKGYLGNYFNGVILVQPSFGTNPMVFLDNGNRRYRYKAYYNTNNCIEPYKVEEIRELN